MFDLRLFSAPPLCLVMPQHFFDEARSLYSSKARQFDLLCFIGENFQFIIMLQIISTKSYYGNDAIIADPAIVDTYCGDAVER